MAAVAPDPATVAPRAAPATRRAPGRITSLVDEAGEFAGFAARALRALPGTLRYSSEIARINALVTRRTTVLLFLMCFFLGLSASNFAFFFLRSIGASDFVAFFNGLVTPRQIAPQMFGYVLAGSVCCAIAAETGAAKIQEEIAAYESEGVDPLQYVVGTRLLAVLLFVPLALVVSYLGCLAGGYFSVVVLLEGNSSQVWLSTFFGIQTPTSFLFCGLTLAAIAIVCVLVSCFYGLRTKGGPDAVGGAVARSLALNLVLLHLIVTALALVFYGGQLPVPIGD